MLLLRNLQIKSSNARRSWIVPGSVGYARGPVSQIGRRVDHRVARARRRCVRLKFDQWARPGATHSFATLADHVRCGPIADYSPLTAFHITPVIRQSMISGICDDTHRKIQLISLPLLRSHRAREPVQSIPAAAVRRDRGRVGASHQGRMAHAQAPTKRRARKRRSLLLLAEWLPPDRVQGGSYRPTSFLQYARENGWRVTAITAELVKPPDRAALELASRIPKDCSIIRVPAPSFQAIRGSFRASMAR